MYIVKEGNTWASIAERFLGNATLGRNLAGQNGCHEEGEPIVGARIVVIAGREDDLEEPAVAPSEADARAGGGNDWDW